MSAHCGCYGCQHPTDANAELRVVHATRHALFESIVSERPDRHGFTQPSSDDILRWTIAEWDVPRTCPRAEDAGKPAHPVHRA